MRSSGVVKVSRGGSPMWVSARFLKILLVCVGLFFIYDGLKKVTDKIDVEAFKNATAHFEKVDLASCLYLSSALRWILLLYISLSLSLSLPPS